MEPPRRPSNALLPAQRVGDEEAQDETLERIPAQFHGPRYLTSLFSYPGIVAFRPLGPTFGDLIPLRRWRQVGGPQNGQSYTRGRPARESNNGASEDDNRTEQSPEEEEEATEAQKKSEPLLLKRRRAEHKKRFAALTKELEPMSSENGSAVVLLCWGEKTSCSIMPVPVAHPEDEVATWAELNNAWYARRGEWRRKLPWYGIKSVDIVEVTMLGLKNSSNHLRQGEYIGMYTEKDIPGEVERSQAILNSDLPLWASECSYERKTDTMTCDFKCCCGDCGPDDMDKCPQRTFRDARRELFFLDTLSMMRLVFSNPVLAASSDFLEKGKLVYSHRDVLWEIDYEYFWHCPRLREIKFRGLVIKEGWILDTSHVVLTLGATILLGVVMVAKFIFDWSTAWNVGSFFVALVALLWTWAAHMSTR